MCYFTRTKTESKFFKLHLQLKEKFKLKNKNFQFELFFQVQMRCSNTFLASASRLSENNFLKIRDVLVTQRIYSRLHSFTQHFVFTAFDMHRFTTLARKHEGTTRKSRDATNTIAGYPRGTITSQVCSVSYLVYPSGCNGL